MARDEKILIRCSEEEYQDLEALAEVYLDCSMAEAGRTAWTELAHRAFGDLDRDALVDGRISDADLQALREGEKSSEDFPEDVRDDVDEPEAVAPDGGSKPTPNSYSATYGPQDIRRSGPMLSWDELKDTIRKYWSDELEIHPDRVPFAPSREAVETGDPARLKQVNSVTPKVLAGMCRHVAEDDVMPGPVLDEMIEDYLAHFNRRDDKREGWQYLRDTYRERVGEYLYEHPDPGKDVYYTSESMLRDIVTDGLRNPIELHVDTAKMFNRLDWIDANDVGGTPEEQYEAWYANLGRYIDRLAMMHRLSTDETYRPLTEEADVDLSETEYDDPVHYAVVLWRSRIQDYQSRVGTENRDLVVEEYASPEAISVLEDVL